MKQVQHAFERALVTFTAVRGINALISIVQGPEVAMEPGEIFDPMNDSATATLPTPTAR